MLLFHLVLLLILDFNNLTSFNVIASSDIFGAILQLVDSLLFLSTNLLRVSEINNNNKKAVKQVM